MGLCLSINSCRYVDRINCGLVTPGSRQTQSISDIYFDVAMILSKWSRQQIIKLSHMVLSKRNIVPSSLLEGFLPGGF